VERDRQEAFFARVLQVAEKHNLQYHDLPRPYLRETYEDYPVDVFGEKCVSAILKGGHSYRNRMLPPLEETICEDAVKTL